MLINNIKKSSKKQATKSSIELIIIYRLESIKKQDEEQPA